MSNTITKPNNQEERFFVEYGGIGFIQASDVQLPGNYAACLEEMLEECDLDVGGFLCTAVINAIIHCAEPEQKEKYKLQSIPAEARDYYKKQSKNNASINIAVENEYAEGVVRAVQWWR